MNLMTIAMLVPLIAILVSVTLMLVNGWDTD